MKQWISYYRPITIHHYQVVLVVWIYNIFDHELNEILRKKHIFRRKYARNGEIDVWNQLVAMREWVRVRNTEVEVRISATIASLK